MKNRKLTLALYYYIRYSLVLYLLVLPFGIAYFLFEVEFPVYFEKIYFPIIICCFPAFLILPGIIYEGEYKGFFHGITADQFKYSLFFGLTLGLGPMFVYFKKYDKTLKTLIIDNQSKENTATLEGN
ncbi:hypothetical protein D1BOALGB6SA_9260 [Olavius sp. associated proteobacterium Delta 1]|nr:hypothetical protein D1BOALGB6SA_9260 [Olavius sp. associated proteobacterium Delta 1]